MSQPDKNSSSNSESSRYPVSSADALLLLIVLIWGANISIIKVGLAEIDPLPFATLRFCAGAAILWIILLLTKTEFKFSRADGFRLLMLALVGHVVFQPLFILGIANTTAGNSALLVATSPVMVAVIMHCRRVEPLGIRAWAGVFLSFVGVLLIIHQGAKEIAFSYRTLFGDMLMLLSSLVFSVYTIMLKPLVGRVAPLALATATITIGSLGLLVVTCVPLLQQDWGAVGSGGWMSLMYSGPFVIGIGYFIWATGVRHIGSTRTSLYLNLTTVCSLAIAIVFLKERAYLGQLVGGAMVILGVILTRAKPKG